MSNTTPGVRVMEKKSPPSQVSIINHRPKVLIGVTGSVAAIKGPELAVRLATDLNANVRILLTHGGANFWTKSGAYNEKAWNEMTELCQEAGHSTSKKDDDRDGGTISIYCKYTPLDRLWRQASVFFWRLGDDSRKCTNKLCRS